MIDNDLDLTGTVLAGLVAGFGLFTAIELLKLLVSGG